MTTLKVEGMTCGHCVAAVKKALESVPGVAEARVDLDAGTAEVRGEAPLGALMSAVEAEGYKASAQVA